MVGEERRVQGLRFRVQGLGFRVWGLGFRVWGLGFRVWGLGFAVRRDHVYNVFRACHTTENRIVFWNTALRDHSITE